MKDALPDFMGERREALLRRDWDRLEQLLDPELRYVHATGVCHDKTGYLAFVRERIRIDAMHLEDVNAWSTDAVTVLTARLHQTIVRAGETESVRVASWITEVWRKTDTWRLLAFQSTRLPA